VLAAPADHADIPRQIIAARTSASPPHRGDRRGFTAVRGAIAGGLIIGIVTIRRRLCLTKTAPPCTPFLLIASSVPAASACLERREEQHV